MRKQVKKYESASSSCDLPVLHVTIQLAANLLASSPSFRSSSLPHLTPVATTILTRLQDPKSQNLAACVLLQAWKQSDSCDGSREVLLCLCGRGRDSNHCDFALLCVRHLALSADFFCALTREQRIHMLDLVRDLELLTADDDEGGAHAQLPLVNLLALVSDFTYLTDVILTTSLGTVCSFSVPNPHGYRFTSILVGWRSKNTHRNRKKLGSLCFEVLDVLFRGLKAGSLGIIKFNF